MLFHFGQKLKLYVNDFSEEDKTNHYNLIYLILLGRKKHLQNLGVQAFHKYLLSFIHCNTHIRQP